MEIEYTAVAEDATPALSSNRTFTVMDDGFSSFGEVLDVSSLGEGETKKSVACDEFVDRVNRVYVSSGIDERAERAGSGWSRMQSEGGDGVFLTGEFEDFLFESVMVNMSFDEESCSVEVSVSLFVDDNVESWSDLSDSEVREDFDAGVRFMSAVVDELGEEFCEDVLDVGGVRVFA